MCLALLKSGGRQHIIFSEPTDGEGVILKHHIDVGLDIPYDLQLSGDWTIEALMKFPTGYITDQIHII